MIDRYRGALIGTSVGDALGAPVKGHPSPLDYVATLERGRHHLRFTDDTAHLGSFHDAIKTAISLGGDTDTIAAMTGALTGAHLGIDAIPEPWRKVEGHETLRRLADQLHSRHTTTKEPSI